MSEDQIRQQQIKLLESQYKFAPSVSKINKLEKENILMSGSKDLKKRLGVTNN